MLKTPQFAKVFGLDPVKLKTDRARGTVPLSGREKGRNPSYGPVDLVAFALHDELRKRNFTSSGAAREVLTCDAPYQIVTRLKAGSLTDCLLVLSQEMEEHPKLRGVVSPIHHSDFVSISDLPDYVAQLGPRVGSFTVVALGPLWKKLVARAGLAGVALYPDGEMIIEADAE